MTLAVPEVEIRIKEYYYVISVKYRGKFRFGKNKGEIKPTEQEIMGPMEAEGAFWLAREEGKDNRLTYVYNTDKTDGALILQQFAVNMLSDDPLCVLVFAPKWVENYKESREV